MANPNIVAVTTIYGKTVGMAVTTSNTAILNNNVTGELLKVNTILISNVDGTNSADVTASVYIGGTHEVNISYPDTFHIIKNGAKYYPNPMRVSMLNSTLADKLNQKRGIFTDDEIKSHIKEIVKRIEGRKRVTETVAVKTKKEKSEKGFS